MEVRNKYQQKLVPLDEGERRAKETRLTEGCTTLMYACSQGLTSKIVNELRNKPNTVLRRDRSNKSALHYCSGQKDLVAAASVAVAAPGLMEAADEDGFTPLHLAVIQGNLSLVNLLLANKADVNALDNEGHSVVHWATVCGEVEALRAVLQAGANVSIPDLNGGSPLHYAAQMCGANYDGKTDKASNKLAMEILNILLAHRGSSVTVEDKDGRQPLLWAASAGSSKSIIALVKAGAHIESADKDGLTALHCAASRGHTDCIDTLINLCGAQTDLIDSNGCTALHYAVTLGHADASSLLLDLNADPNRQDRKGRTPAHCACSKGQLETVKILYARKGNLWLRNVRGDLPLHEAAASGRRELLQWLLEMKRNKVNVTSNDGKTILHIAASNDNTDMCKILLDLGAHVNSIYRTARNVVMTPLDCALHKGFRSTAKFIQMQGGLPASKIRLSARRPVKLPELDQVQPLKFYEKEEITDLNNSKKFIVYIKKSDSESEDEVPRSRIKHRVTRHKRRTSSCSDSIFIQRDDSYGDMSRCKSNMELSRHFRRSKYRSSSSSSESSSDNCCHHIKRKHRCYKKTSPKKCRAKHKQKSLEEEQDSKRNLKKKRKKEKSCKRGDKSGSGGSDGGSPHDSKKEKLETQECSHKPIEYEDLLREQEQATAKQKEISEKNENDNVPKGNTRPGSSNSRPKSARPPSAQTHIEDKANESADRKSKTEGESGKMSGFSEDEAVISEIITKAQVHMNAKLQTKLDPDEDIATDATYTIEPTEKFDSLEPIYDPKADKIIEEKPPKDMEGAVESPKKVSFQEDEAEASAHEALILESHSSTQDTNNHSSTQDTNNEVPLEKKVEQGMMNVSAVIELSKPADIKWEQSAIEILSPPKCESPKSSFTVLDDDDLNPVDVYNDSPSDTTPSDSNQTIKSFHLLDSTETPELASVDYPVEDSVPVQMPIDKGSRKKKLKKKFKSKSTEGDSDDDRKFEQQASKDHDSGFEPSPRAGKTKIPSPRSTHTASLPRKSGITKFESIDAPNAPPVRARSSRLGRKPGDQYAVNMTSVTQSIQRNIRRYYMERKIFQHLLELKSLQIRSNKAHEAVVVKRAVDDYHKSTHALEYEVGTALRKYPYREYTFKNFELFLYETLKGLQKNGTFNFQNLSEVYREAERRLSPDISRYENALHCTTKTHRCLHAAHAYTGIPCAAYIPMINHHTIPKLGFGAYKSTSGIGSFYLPKILSSNTANSKFGNKVALELSHGNNKQLISLPSDKLDKNKRYYVTFTSVKGGEGGDASGNTNVNLNNKNQTTINLQSSQHPLVPLSASTKDEKNDGGGFDK